MMSKQTRKLTVLTLLLVVSLAVVSFYGAFVPLTYERDAASMAAQGMGQDIVDLFLVVPLLAISLIFVLRNSRVALCIYGGTLLYILYSFFIYSFGVHFNNLFLLYCLTLGLSLYAFILLMYEFARMDAREWFGDKVPTRSIGIYLIIISMMFYSLWLRDIIPAIAGNSVPRSVSDYELLVNPVHVLDIAIFLPGLIITAILLMRKHRFGYVLAPILLVFVIILAIALAGMVIMVKAKGMGDDTSVAGIFALLAVISFIFLFAMLKSVKSAVVAGH
jgi:hypothetical protein